MGPTDPTILLILTKRLPLSKKLKVEELKKIKFKVEE